MNDESQYCFVHSKASAPCTTAARAATPMHTAKVGLYRENANDRFRLCNV
jgi:hypothetical protein